MSFNLTGKQVRGPLRWWYTLAAPRDVAEDAPLRERERVRIGKLTSLALLIEIIAMGIAGYSTTEDPNQLLPIVYLGIVLSLLIAMMFNRSGKIKVAGILVVVMIEIGLLLTIVGIPHGQFSSFNLPIFALFIQPLLIAASIFPIEIIFPMAAFHIVCICLALTFIPKAPELIEHMRIEPYTAYGMPIMLQVFAALISFIWVRSAREEMHRAETAQEVTRLTQELADQMLAAADRQEELKRNIEIISRTLAEVSKGNYQQQVPLTQKDLLGPVAHSFNMLINYTRGYREQGQRFEQIDKLLSSLASELRQYRTSQGQNQISVTNTGTGLDLLTVELRNLLQALPVHPNAQSPDTENLPPKRPIYSPYSTPTEPDTTTRPAPQRTRFSPF
ncbi:MAG: hypothetical protein H0U76_15215 [Ktedonobacteraceae bacterium]|nr:hypothetical protein [Ktedonobacteraceae bacterium]